MQPMASCRNTGWILTNGRVHSWPPCGRRPCQIWTSIHFHPWHMSHVKDNICKRVMACLPTDAIVECPAGMQECRGNMKIATVDSNKCSVRLQMHGNAGVSLSVRHAYGSSHAIDAPFAAEGALFSSGVRQLAACPCQSPSVAIACTSPCPLHPDVSKDILAVFENLMLFTR